MPVDDSELDRLAQFRLPMPIAPVCPNCRYNLTGLKEPRCPECGYRFDWRTVRQRARQQWLEALGLKDLPQDVAFGFRASVAAWGVAILFVLTAFGGAQLQPYSASTTLYWLALVMYVVAMFLAVAGVLLCSHILRFRRLPEEAREALRIDVPETQAWSGLLCSGLLLLIGLPLCLMLGAIL